MLHRLSSFLLQPSLIQLDPEQAHHYAMQMLKAYSLLPALSLQTPKQTLSLMHLEFSNRLGLAAGFDKNAECLYAWEKLGFGFAEVGTVTALPQAGNPKPRIFRLPEHKALWNRMGFNNDGCDHVARRIERQRKRHKISIPIGINLGKSKAVPLEQASQDYERSFLSLADLADYIVINVSSPNTPQLRELQKAETLPRLLDHIGNLNARRRSPRPLLLKVSPDLSEEELLLIADQVCDSSWQGLVLTNTSTNKKLAQVSESFGSGGLSGLPLFDKSTELLKVIKTHVGDKLTLIASGGVMSAEHATEKRKHGADLVQVYTAFIYEGPALITRIRKALTIPVPSVITTPKYSEGG